MNKLPVLLLALAVPAWGTAGQSYYHTAAALASYGGAVAVNETHLFIAEPQGFKHPGAIHVLAPAADQWERVAYLQAPEGYVNDNFGGAIAAGDATLLATHASGVYFFEFDGSTWSPVYHAPVPGAAVAISGTTALVGVEGGQDEAGAVHIYRRTNGAWEEAGQLSNNSPGYGVAVAIDQNVAMVGSASTITFYQWDQGTFVEQASFSDADVQVTGPFGVAIHLDDGEALVGSFMDQDRTGSVQVFRFDGSWQLDRQLRPGEDAPAGTGFGLTVQANASGYWVSAPIANRGVGMIHYFPREGDDAAVFAPENAQGAVRFGMSLAANDHVVVAGMPNKDYGEGGAAVFTNTDGQWSKGADLMNTIEVMDPIMGEGARCDAGAAADYACNQVDLVSFLPLADLGVNRGVRLNDVWGWTDPESGREYALVGHLEGTAFVDVSNPSMPIFLGELPRTEGSPGSTWRDIKVYQDHAFIVADGAGAHGMQVFDLTRLRNVPGAPITFDADAHYDQIHSAHNIVINEDTGYAFSVGSSGGAMTCGGGLHMIDIREPQSPVFAGCFGHEGTGRRNTGYSHDAQCVIYHGPDAAYTGKEICVGSNETAISIADITDKDNPVTISSGSYPDAAYVHQGWLSEDHAYFYQNDELDELQQRVDRTRTLIWDIRDLDDPILANEYLGPTSATDHNLYVHENLMYQTNNASGLRILDITDRTQPQEVGFFDTTPYGTDDSGFNGTWSSYPYFESGIIVVTSRREGLYILKKQSVGS